MSGLAKQFSTMKHEAKRAKSACSTVTFSGQQILDVFDALEAVQRDRAELSDKLNGTPCAEIQWRQERDDLRALLVRAGEAMEPLACDCYSKGPCKNSADGFGGFHFFADDQCEKFNVREVLSAIRTATQQETK